VFHRAVAKSNAAVIPVDSEHNAIFQVFRAADVDEVDRVTLTASGGPFLEWTLERMRAATPEQAVAHPNWSMGAKISVDSATLMNKGLELIEAHFLFALPAEKLAVVVHPQSIVHCLVSYADGSTLAHLSAPDMRTPIAHALAWPRRISSPSRKLDLLAVAQLTFRAPDRERFRCLALALDCLNRGGLAPTILNAANEIAVAAFLSRRIGFLDIPRVVETTLDESPGANVEAESLDGVLAADARARELAGNICRRMMT
jgi:1-deoxy-D-xylulose-5-phosphate reductoisomerase